MLKNYMKYALVVALLLTGCFSAKNDRSFEADVSSEYHQGFKEEDRINEILVIPAFTRESSKPGQKVASGKLYYPDSILTDRLIRSLEIYTDLNIIKPDENGDYLSGTVYDVNFKTSGLTQEAILKFVRKVQEKTGAHHVLFSQIDITGNRTGSSLGSERSAQINYRIWLFSGQLQKAIWSSAYQSKQETLSENLFQIKKRFKDGVGFSDLHDLISKAFIGSAKKLNKAVEVKKNRGKN